MSECNEFDCAEGTLECGGLTPPSRLGLYALGTPRRRQAAALQGASRVFMHGSEPQDHEAGSAVRAGLVSHPEEWPWSSVHDYTGSVQRPVAGPRKRRSRRVSEEGDSALPSLCVGTCEEPQSLWRTRLCATCYLGEGPIRVTP